MRWRNGLPLVSVCKDDEDYEHDTLSTKFLPSVLKKPTIASLT